MPALLSHYRPDAMIFAFTESRPVQRRLALYHGVTALHMTFGEAADETFDRCTPATLVTIVSFLFYVPAVPTNSASFFGGQIWLLCHCRWRGAVMMSRCGIHLSYMWVGAQSKAGVLRSARQGRLIWMRRAIQELKARGYLRGGQQVGIVQSGRQPIWRAASTHAIQVRARCCYTWPDQALSVGTRACRGAC
jgi:hypothetical protein